MNSNEVLNFNSQYIYIRGHLFETLTVLIGLYNWGINKRFNERWREWNIVDWKHHTL